MLQHLGFVGCVSALKGAGLISTYRRRNLVKAEILGVNAIKILALAFRILIGVMLLVESMGGHVDKGYIYFAMTFSFLIELINMR